VIARMEAPTGQFEQIGDAIRGTAKNADRLEAKSNC
jgi:hypothetical protein